MADLNDTLQSVLSDPDAMSKIMELGKSLGLTGNTSQSNSNAQPSQSTSAPDLSALGGLLSGNLAQSKPSYEQGLNLSPEVMSLIAKFLPLLNCANKEDESTILLRSLKPFLSESKRHRLDEAEKMLRIMKVLPMIRQAGLL